MSNFADDLNFGKYYEAKYIEIGKFDSIHYPKDEKYSEYDFKDLKTGLSYEIKADKMTARTNNMFIEFECNGNKSGINVTKADYFVYFVCDLIEGKNCRIYYEIPVIKLKEMILNEEYTKIVSGGDRGRSKGYIFYVSLMREFMKFCKIEKEQTEIKK